MSELTSEQPLLLDLFCGAGGSARGYQQAGFRVLGVDHKVQPRYVGDDFVQDDALTYLDKLRQGFDGGLFQFAAIHASPPCQHYSLFSRNTGTADNHPDLVPPTQEALRAIGQPYVIENVVGAPLRDPIKLCGSSFGLQTKGGLGLRRHRLFESSVPLMAVGCTHGYEKDSIGVFGNGTPQWFRKKHGRNARLSEWKEAMGIDWMTRDELAEAIPPAYTEFIGRQLIDQLARCA